MLLMILFQPLCHCCLLCVFVVHRQRLLFSCMVWFTFMYFFWKLGDPFPILSPKHGECASFLYLGTLMTVVAFFSHNVRVLDLQKRLKVSEVMAFL